MFSIVCVVAGVTLVMYWNSSKLRNGLRLLGYEFIFWILGGASTLDDAIHAWKNRLNALPIKTGEVAVITGGTRGIGYEVIKKLLQCDMTVIMGCKKVEIGEEAIRSIRHGGIHTGNTKVFELDTSSMSSVQTFAKNVNSNFCDIHILINNAGIMFVPHALTEDGFESHLSVNYLGHFLLTHLLLPTLKETGRKSENKARIVNVSSCAHIPGSINFDDINFIDTYYIPSQAYAQSKLAQLMFSKAVDRKMKSEGSRVLSLAVHPGVVNTALFNDTLLKRLFPWLPKLFFKSPEKGAYSVVFAALSDTLEDAGGAYISNCAPTWTSCTARNEIKQDRLMNLTLEMLELGEFGASESHESSCEKQ